MNQQPATVYTGYIFLFLYAVFFLSIFCGLRVLNSVSLATITGAGLLCLIFSVYRGEKPKPVLLFMAGSLLFYLVQLAGMLYTHHEKTGWRQLEVKLTLVLVPLLFWGATYLNTAFRRKVMPAYVLILAGFIGICLVIAGVKYSATGNSEVFFYHALVKPFLNHAIQTSLLVFVALVYLLECCRSHRFLLNKPVHFTLIAFFFGALILLSSKLIILFSFVAGLVYLRLLTRSAIVPRKRMQTYVIVAVLVLIAVIFTRNPVSTRFRDLFNGSITKVEQTAFVPGDYFNGIQFRVLQWKFVAEILDSNKAWVGGMSPGDAQKALDEKYISVNMYVGDGKTNRGFLGYNTHNQFLESVLQSGIFGLAAFLLIIVGLFQLMIRRNQVELWLTGTLLFLYCFQDAVFQTQFGGLIFLFFPLLQFFGSGTAPRGAKPVVPISAD